MLSRHYEQGKGHDEISQTGTNVLPYVSAIIITAILCLSLIIAVYLVVRRRNEVHEIIDNYSFLTLF